MAVKNIRGVAKLANRKRKKKKKKRNTTREGGSPVYTEKDEHKHNDTMKREWNMLP